MHPQVGLHGGKDNRASGRVLLAPAQAVRNVIAADSYRPDGSAAGGGNAIPGHGFDHIVLDPDIVHGGGNENAVSRPVLQTVADNLERSGAISPCGRGCKLDLAATRGRALVGRPVSQVVLYHTRQATKIETSLWHLGPSAASNRSQAS